MVRGAVQVGTNLGAFPYEVLNRFYRMTHDADLNPSHVPVFLGNLGFVRKGYIKERDSRPLVYSLTNDHGYITLFSEEPNIHGEQKIQPTELSGTLYVSKKPLNMMDGTELLVVMNLIKSKNMGTN
ncbi:MAG: hypothetical protein JW716_02405 [Candidatus Aenigmarchaeota archaeon]|nr:hypothetical protein [Candidatus Aenigmarchaeota archaeon]